ncbi:YdeI/OmpD-associated family protein [Amnibacterium sp. CER49]|uniref:YdeI/OmpD-associated family protein n=1 Tax=Amnibacterium sp. CER49 TaxID=3039161 RepID=UPI00244A2702|nr:YdeI/OmpD-associated family protein [Amnibacterium sp. CER49]MDH2444775.1 YdeI/OmpD-associated family protein [Amnibacterium sp. CER49]
MPEREVLFVPDADAWERWLEEHATTSPGVRLALAKKGGGGSSPTYDEALEHALCFGWIDSQVGRLDERFYTQVFTPRGPRSVWSQRNTGIAERLAAEGRMREAGLREVERAKADGRWERAYASSSTAEVPDDLAAAIAASPRATAAFARLNRQNRYAVLYRVGAAKRPETRARRIAQFVAMLERGETVYPQQQSLEQR